MGIGDFLSGVGDAIVPEAVEDFAGSAVSGAADLGSGIVHGAQAAAGIVGDAAQGAAWVANPYALGRHRPWRRRCRQLHRQQPRQDLGHGLRSRAPRRQRGDPRPPESCHQPRHARCHDPHWRGRRSRLGSQARHGRPHWGRRHASRQSDRRGLVRGSWRARCDDIDARLGRSVQGGSGRAHGGDGPARRRRCR